MLFSGRTKQDKASNLNWRQLLDPNCAKNLGLTRENLELAKHLPLCILDDTLYIAYWDDLPNINIEDDFRLRALRKGVASAAIRKVEVIKISEEEAKLLLASAFPTTMERGQSVRGQLRTEPEESLTELYLGEEHFWDLDLRDRFPVSSAFEGEISFGFYQIDPKTKDKKYLAEPLQFLYYIMYHAMLKQATDVHIDPVRQEILPEGQFIFRNQYVVRYTIDGRLQEGPKIPKTKGIEGLDLGRRICAAINYNSSVGYKPEGMGHAPGRATLKFNEQLYDLRIQVFSGIYGESYTIRILPQSAQWTIHNLGFSPHNLERINYALGISSGMVYVTGPTGSGKSTTVYALLLQKAEKRNLKIVSIEDPVEYQIPGVQQVMYNDNEKYQQTFREMIKVFLRCAPHVIFVGETRDKEVADAAAQAAETGHLVISTLHANDAIGVFRRLISLGLREDLLYESLKVVIAQRLVRLVNEDAWEIVEGLASEVVGPLWTKSGLVDRVVRVAVKPKNNNETTWYSGRIAVHEVLIVTDEIRHLVMRAYGGSKRSSRSESSNNSSEDVVEDASGPVLSSDIKRLAMNQGMMTMWQDGLEKLDFLTVPGGRAVSISSLREQIEPDFGFIKELQTFPFPKWDLTNKT